MSVFERHFETDCVNAVIVYNPLDFTDRALVHLDHQPEKYLEEYLEGLPEEIDWYVSLNGVEIVPVQRVSTRVEPGDTIVAVPVPHGGDEGGKSVLTIVATLALAVAAPMLGGALAGAMGFSTTGTAAAIFTAGVSIAGSVLIGAMLPKPDLGGDNAVERASYGLDGAKNTSTEAIPVPIVYGWHRWGGNLVDSYTKNVTDANGDSTQDLYLRALIGEGPIAGITEIELDGQPIGNFQDVVTDFRLGVSNQSMAGWFGDTVTLVNQGREITQEWSTYETSQEVDALRIDTVSPSGIAYVDNEGRKHADALPIEIEYRISGETDWTPLKNIAGWEIGNGAAKNYRITGGLRNVPSGPLASGFSYSITLQYRPIGAGGSWIPVATRTGQVPAQKIEGNDVASGNVVEEVFEVNMNTSVAREWRIAINSGPGEGYISLIETATEAGSDLFIRDDTTSTVRRTFQTGVLEQGVYEVRWRRLTADPDNQHTFNTTLVSDIGEIVRDDVALVNSAWFALKVRLSGQLSSIPSITALVQGRIMPIFDHTGRVVDVAFSRNPADVALDILTNTRFGGAIERERVDWAAFAEWRDFCDANDLHFDGVFYETSNINDALKSVFLSGRAQWRRHGARVSVAIDRPDTPVMMFTSSTIIKGSFGINYIGFEDRINDLELQFNDAEDSYKPRSVRITNHVAIQRGEPLKSTLVTLKGITSEERASREGIYRMNYNRLVARTASWESPVEAIACTVGDHVVVQHEMPGWGKAGKLEADSTALTLQLDRAVTFEAGKSYRVLINQDTRLVSTPDIIGKSGALVVVDQAIGASTPIRRALYGGQDYAVLRVILQDDGNTAILLEPRAASVSMSGSIQLWNTDALIERTVTNPASSGVVETDQITVSSGLGFVPDQYASWMFGEVNKVKKPFRVVAIERTEEHISRITAVEYVPEVFSDVLETETNNYSDLLQRGHVRSLQLEEKIENASSGGWRTFAEAKWVEPAEGVYIGADIYLSVNGARLEKFAETAAKKWRFLGKKGDDIVVKVVAKTVNGTLSPKNAPTASLTLVGKTIAPAMPIGWVGVAGIDTITLKGPKSINRDFSRFRIYGAPLGVDFDHSTPLADTRSNTWTYPVPKTDATQLYWVTEIDLDEHESQPFGPINVRPKGVSKDDFIQSLIDEYEALQEGVQQALANGAEVSDTVSEAVADMNIRFNDLQNQINSLTIEGLEDVLEQIQEVRDELLGIDLSILERGIEQSLAKGNWIKDPLFKNWNSGSTSLIDWSESGGIAVDDATVTRLTGSLATVYGSAVRVDIPAGAYDNATLSATTNVGQIVAPEITTNWMVLTGIMEMVSGTYANSAFRVEFRNPATNAWVRGDMLINGSLVTAANGSFVQCGFTELVGQRQMREIIVRRPQNFSAANLRVMVIGRTSAATNQLSFICHFAALRAATAAEIAAAEAKTYTDAQITSTAATLSSVDTALATQIDALTTTVNGNQATLTANYYTKTDTDTAISLAGTNLTSTLSPKIDAKGRVIYAATAPTSTEDRNANNIWIDTGGTPPRYHPYRWTGSAWVRISDSGIAAVQSTLTTNYYTKVETDEALSSASTTLTSVFNTGLSAKGRIIYAATAPTAAADRNANNLWIDIGGTPPRNHPYRWNGTAWVRVSDNDIAVLNATLTNDYYTKATADSATAAAVNGLSSTLTPQINAKGRVIYATTAPTAAADRNANNIWIDIGGSPPRNHPYRWNGTAWVQISDSGISALSATLTTGYYTKVATDGAIASAMTTLSADYDPKINAKGRVIYATTAPTSTADRNANNLWIDIGGSPARNHPYRWNGSAWVRISDIDISTISANLTNNYYTKAAADSATAAQIQTYDANFNTKVNAYVNLSTIARTTVTNALAGRLDTLEARTEPGAVTLNTDFNTGDLTGWTQGSGVTVFRRGEGIFGHSASSPGRAFAVFPPNASAIALIAPNFIVEPGDLVSVSMQLAGSATPSAVSGTMRLVVRFLDVDGAIISGSTHILDTALSSAAGWQKRQLVNRAAPAGAAYGQIFVQRFAGGGGSLLVTNIKGYKGEPGSVAQIIDLTATQTDQASSIAGINTTLYASSSGLVAQVSSQSAAIANINGRLNATYALKVDAGNPAELVLVSQTNGTVSTSAARIRADMILLEGTVLAEHMVIGGYANAIRDDQLQSPNYWYIDGAANLTSFGEWVRLDGNAAFDVKGEVRCTPATTTGTSLCSSRMMATEPGTKYSWRFEVRGIGTGTFNANARILWYDKSETLLDNDVIGSATFNGNTTYNRVGTTELTAPANAFYMRWRWEVPRTSVIATITGVRFSSPTLRRKSKGVEIENGAITADHIFVASLSAISANLGTIKVGSAHIENLSVGTGHIANNAVTIPVVYQNNSAVSVSPTSYTTLANFNVSMPTAGMLYVDANVSVGTSGTFGSLGWDYRLFIDNVQVHNVNGKALHDVIPLCGGRSVSSGSRNIRVDATTNHTFSSIDVSRITVKSQGILK